MSAPIRLLLVEDDPAYARLVKERLRDDDGCTLVAIAETLAEGITAAARHAPQVILLDLALPDSEGIATLDAIHEAAPRVPIVVLSGQDDLEVVLEAMRHGAQEYLVKGVAEAQLLPRIVRLAIERKRLQDVEQLLVGVVSHDLRGPLQTIALNCELVAEQLDGPAKLRLERVMRAANRARTLVDDLLDATRARLGGLLPIARDAVDLVPIVEHAIEEHRSPAHAIRAALPAALVADVDGPRIAQIVGNLVGNAVQHSAPQSEVRVDLREANGAVELVVHNTGAPIAPGLRDKLFEPLERAATANHTHSIGLGLYIVAEIVRAHGGEIAVTSTSEAGTTFVVRLPR